MTRNYNTVVMLTIGMLISWSMYLFILALRSFKHIAGLGL